MEELQSTEILDREILEDARKKAQRILRAADDTIMVKTAEWKNKTAKSIEELGKKYNEQKEFNAAKIMARLPIDKRRAKVEKIESLLSSAVEFWYKSLSREKILELLTSELSKRLDICEGFSSSNAIRAFYSALDLREVQTILNKIKITCAVEEIQTESLPSVILETESTRVTASIQKIADYYLHVKRSELVEALVGSALTGETS
jgi:vacuolar-type H+-ATPase subunit E/Vma4